MTVSAISTVSRVLRSIARDKLPPIERDDSCSPAKMPAPVEEIAGKQPRHQSRKKHQAERKRQHSSIQVNGLGTRQIVPVVRKPTSGQERKQNAERSTGRADKQALGHLFSDEHKPAAP